MKTKVKEQKEVKEVKQPENAKEKMELEVVKEVMVRKELRYKYPKGMIDTVQRKSYRQKVRNKIEKAEFRASGGEDAKELRLAKKELKELQEKYLA